MSSPADLVDDVLAEILLRLPAECVLRCRAVCKRWRRVTTCPTFAAAYSRRRPLELLAYPAGFFMGLRARNPLAAVDPAGDARRRLLRFHSPAHLVGSCDGLLLFAVHMRSFLVCNPATRQWAWLPPLPPWRFSDAVASGFYFHRPSGEHRVLCNYSVPMHHATPPSSSSSSSEAMAIVGDFHYIVSIGAGAVKPRNLGRVAEGGHDPFPSACVTLGATLYWLHHPEAGGSGDVVAFDTVSETFRRLPRPPPPPSGHHLRAFDMDGRLAVSAVEELSRRMDVWALQDDSGGCCWSCILRIDDLPPLRYCHGWNYQSYEAVAVLEGGALVVVGGCWVVLFDVKDKRELSRVDHRGRVLNLSRWLYRESLVPLPEPDGRPWPGGFPGGEPLPEPDARPWPVGFPGGEPLLHYYSSSSDDDDADVALYGNRISYTWIVANDQ